MPSKLLPTSGRKRAQAGTVAERAACRVPPRIWTQSSEALLRGSAALGDARDAHEIDVGALVGGVETEPHPNADCPQGGDSRRSRLGVVAAVVGLPIDDVGLQLR